MVELRYKKTIFLKNKYIKIKDIKSNTTLALNIFLYL
ncbi:MAG: hypothetical protein PWQ82_1057 [Thermosediminibacterales bacterium]|nr:hypothetical protein [Thermosediminibacterales bacterium]